jgi:hypothetical protein
MADHRVDSAPGSGGLLVLVRTVAMFTSLLVAGGAGVVAGTLRRNPRFGVDLATALFGRFGPRLGSFFAAVLGGVRRYHDQRSTPVHVIPCPDRC